MATRDPRGGYPARVAARNAGSGDPHARHPEQPYVESQTHRIRRAHERIERDGGILGIQQTIELRPSRPHSLCHRCLGQACPSHLDRQLMREHALDRQCFDCLIQSPLVENPVPVGPDVRIDCVSSRSFHDRPFRRRSLRRARSRSGLGALRSFLMTPCNRTKASISTQNSTEPNASPPRVHHWLCTRPARAVLWSGLWICLRDVRAGSRQEDRALTTLLPDRPLSASGAESEAAEAG